jgi:hypothetical protein
MQHRFDRQPESHQCKRAAIWNRDHRLTLLIERSFVNVGNASVRFGLTTSMAIDPLNADLARLPLPLNSRHAIIRNFWGYNLSLSEYERQARDTDSYFRYYEEQCRAVLCEGGANTLVRTHADIAKIVRLFKDGAQTRESIEDALRDQQLHSSVPNLENAINFALRLWLMVHVGSFARGLIPGQHALAWKSGSLRSLIDAQFPPLYVLGEPVKLEKIFTARNLERIAGIKIIWTDNLADHLRMRDDDTRVAIFHHVSFLEYHQHW